MYSSTTHNVTVSVETVYLDQESAPDKNHYVWAYTVRIENQGTETLQLMSRYWRITDAAGRVHEVRGPGVVGEQPVLKPGARFEYTSGTPLTTPHGMMNGSYSMQADNGHAVDVDIPAFSLDTPQAAARPN
jgi:ApaG protein